MADFYPLLARAVAGLPDNNPVSRNAVYERAREVLLRQLRALDPPLSNEDVAREMVALDFVIDTIEREHGVTPGAPASPAASAPAPAAKAAPPQAAAPQGTSPQATPPQVPAAQTTPPAGQPAASVPRPPAGQPGAGPAPVSPATPVAPAKPAAAPNPSAPVKAAAPARPSGPTPPAPEVDATADGDSRRPRLAPQRPERGKDKRTMVVGAVVAVVVAAIAGLAYWVNKVNSPERQEVASQAPAPQADVDQKFNERVGQPSAPSTSQEQRSATPGPTAPINGAQKAILYEETPDNPQAPKVVQGKVTWKLDSSSPGQGQPLETVVNATVEVPDAGLSMVMTMRRNADSTLPASHIVELTFAKADMGDGRVIRDVGVPQFKTEENARGVPLVGLPVPVTDTVFLIGLSNLPADVERNLDLLRNRPWIDLPIRYANGRRAVLALEKGATGEAVINQALDAWQAKQ